MMNIMQPYATIWQAWLYESMSWQHCWGEELEGYHQMIDGTNLCSEDWGYNMENILQVRDIVRPQSLI